MPSSESTRAGHHSCPSGSPRPVRSRVVFLEVCSRMVEVLGARTYASTRVSYEVTSVRSRKGIGGVILRPQHPVAVLPETPPEYAENCSGAGANVRWIYRRWTERGVRLCMTFEYLHVAPSGLSQVWRLHLRLMGGKGCSKPLASARRVNLA